MQISNASVPAATAWHGAATQQTWKNAWRRNWVLCAGSTIVIVACLMNDFRRLHDFDVWAIRDPGGHLVLVQMLDDGLKPNVDFGFPYGPLTVLICQAWAGVFGNNWFSFLVLLLLFRLISLLLLVTIVARLRLSWLAQAVFVLGLFRWLPFNFSVAHPGQLIGLLLAVLALSYKRIDLALAGCALAVVFRPSAGYPLGLALIAILVWQAFYFENASWRVRSIRWLKSLAPAAILEMFVAAVYTSFYGAISYALTVIPLAGSRAVGHFFGHYFASGWDRFFPPGQNWKGYLFTNPTHLDLLVLVILAAGLIIGTVSFFRRSPTGDDRESEFPSILVLSSIGLIVLFAILTSYGENLSLGYYLPFFWISLFAAWKVLGPWLGKFGTGLLCVVGVNLAACAILSVPVVSAMFRKNVVATYIRLPGSKLSVNQYEYQELQQVSRKVDRRTIVALTYMGDVTLFKYFGISASPNEYWCLERSLSLPEEISRIRNQVRNSEFLLIRTPHAESSFGRNILKRNDLGFDKLRMHTVYDGQSYQLLRIDLPSHEATLVDKQLERYSGHRSGMQKPAYGGRQSP